MNVDLGSLKETLSAVNSAMRVNTIAEEMAHGERVAAAIARESAKRDATLVAGAEASIEQKEILQQQLEMIREQNMMKPQPLSVRSLHGVWRASAPLRFQRS